MTVDIVVNRFELRLQEVHTLGVNQQIETGHPTKFEPANRNKQFSPSTFKILRCQIAR